MMIRKLLVLVLSSWFIVLNLSGCASVPTRENLPTYSINGTEYFTLSKLCDLRSINLDYDTFARTAVLTRGAHRVNLMVGDTLVMVDGQPKNINKPVELYQGSVAVPYRFKQDVLDALFKESAPGPQGALALRSIRKIIIDAGHGGTDPGAIGALGLREKVVALDIAKRLSSIFRSKGIQVVMTRSTDKFIPLPGRVDIANSSGADLFISIHANANRVRGLNGFEVYYVSYAADDSERAMRSAREASLDLDDSQIASNSLDLKATLWDMLYTYSRSESIELARNICNDIDRDLSCRILGIKSANFQVLRGVRVPAVLIEVGFVSNYKEERMLKNDYYRQQVAQAIAQGIENYMRGNVSMEVYNR